jgi:hypothetical protein
MEIEKCEYGCGKDSITQLKNGKWCCSLSPNSCTSNRKKNSVSATKKLKKDYEEGLRKSHFIEYNKTNPHNQKGWIPSETAKENWEKSATLGIGRIGKGLSSTIKKETDRRKSISKSISRRYENGWMPKSGRCEKIKYKSEIAGEVLLDGTWELGVAKHLDKEKINWKRNTKKFIYYFNDKKRRYTPDFYLIDTNEYLEVKGYETELDRSKWSQFTEKLIIWKKKELEIKKII